MKLVLASASPRRRELLANLGFDFEVVPSSVDEESFNGGRPEALARRIARAKAEDVASRQPGAVVLAADTIVVLRGHVLGKPRDAAEVRAMLARLRHRWHRVITAVCASAPGHRTRIEHVVTRVRMRPYAADEVEASIARDDPFDKAGAYAIQDEAFHPVASYEAVPAGRQGCYCNVVGLPLRAVIRLLRQGGVDITEEQIAGLPPECAGCPVGV